MQFYWIFTNFWWAICCASSLFSKVKLVNTLTFKCWLLTSSEEIFRIFSTHYITYVELYCLKGQNLIAQKYQLWHGWSFKMHMHLNRTLSHWHCLFVYKIISTSIVHLPLHRGRSLSKQLCCNCLTLWWHWIIIHPCLIQIFEFDSEQLQNSQEQTLAKRWNYLQTRACIMSWLIAN